MVRSLWIFLCLALICLVGCGRENQADTQLASESNAPPPSSSLSTNDGPSPSDVVSQFLDEVRRGGEDSRANDLLTERARNELQRIGQAVQPIGSPDARFQVTRAETVPGASDSALVHSIWSEPNGDGTNSDFQVVWAVEHEPEGWRISGLAMEIVPDQAPVIMDFENAEMMSKLLQSSGQETPADASGTPETRTSARPPANSR